MRFISFFEDEPSIIPELMNVVISYDFFGVARVMGMCPCVANEAIILIKQLNTRLMHLQYAIYIIPDDRCIECMHAYVRDVHLRRFTDPNWPWVGNVLPHS